MRSRGGWSRSGDGRMRGHGTGGLHKRGGGRWRVGGHRRRRGRVSRGRRGSGSLGCGRSWRVGRCDLGCGHRYRSSRSSGRGERCVGACRRWCVRRVVTAGEGQHDDRCLCQGDRPHGAPQFSSGVGRSPRYACSRIRQTRHSGGSVHHDPIFGPPSEKFAIQSY